MAVTINYFQVQRVDLHVYPVAGSLFLTSSTFTAKLATVGVM